MNIGSKVLAGAAAACLLAVSFAGAANAGTVTLNFIELPNGSINLTGVDIFGNPINVTGSTADAFHLSTPIVPSGYTPDATLSHLGISQSSQGYLFALTEGGAISDYVWVHQFIAGFTVIDFVS